METVWQCEKKSFCLDILEQHWPHVPRSTVDITEVETDDILSAEVWAGGFPCQDVSLARMDPAAASEGSSPASSTTLQNSLESVAPWSSSKTLQLSSHDGRFRNPPTDVGRLRVWRRMASA